MLSYSNLAYWFFSSLQLFVTECTFHGELTTMLLNYITGTLVLLVFLRLVPRRVLDEFSLMMENIGTYSNPQQMCLTESNQTTPEQAANLFC